MMKLSLKLVVAACALLCAHSAAFGCDCVPQSTSQAKKRAEAVFVGTVTESHREMTADGFEWRVRLRVEQTWKGDLGDEVLIYTGGGCEASFEAGKKYLVFAGRERGRGRLYTNMCMKTGALDASADDLQKLGKPKERAAATATAPAKETK